MHSKDAHLSLMEKTDSTALFISTGTDVSDVLADRPMKHYVIPELDELLYAPPAHPYPYDKSYEEAAYDDYLILHSSGSTGPPKPITFNHACTSCLDMQNSVPDIDPITKQTHRRVEAGTRMLIPFLPFHGIVAGVLPSPFIFYGTVYVPGMRNRATKVTDIFPILENANVKDTFLSPAMIEDIVQDPRAAEYLSKFDTVSYGGAKLVCHYSVPLPSSMAITLSFRILGPDTDVISVQNATTCESVAKYTYLRNRWGITENGTCIHYQTAPQDYAYVAFNTRLSGMRFEPIPNTDASDPSQVPHKLYLDPTPTALPYQPYFHRGGPPASRKLESWDVGDTWLPHPDPKLAPFTFRFVGRVDDLISFKDGLNFHPTDWETAHSDHPLVRSAILAGMGHRQVVLLLELHDDAPLTTTEGRKEVMERLWKESIEPINARCPKNGRVGSLENITVQQ